MPTTYTHYRFGDLGLKKLPKDIREIIIKYRGLYDIGLHGPDIFFYYKAYKKNPINTFGDDMHTKSMASFLKNSKMGYVNYNHKPALLAYLLGFVGHFALDSACHTFVEEKTDESRGLSHNLIETQFDQYLMKMDGIDPIKTSSGFSLKPGRKTAKVISRVFPELNSEIIYRSIADQKTIIDLFTVKNEAKRFLLESAFTLSGNKWLFDKLVTKEDLKSCKEINPVLLQLFNEGLERFPDLVLQTTDFLETDVPLGEYFNRHFGPWYEDEA